MKNILIFIKLTSLKSVNRLKLGQVLTVGSVFEVIEMKLKMDAAEWENTDFDEGIQADHTL